ncbi:MULTISPECIES: hypothetical protein [Prauserella salsuginis group]|uniref:DUF2637 domain-containing protein n=1 Tax=Prauserella salsuginis TaxID=387889 RepID=A0ABW6FZG6_9PSEU|nr:MULTISPECIES: hypothetical protein [Prauserella salsuginis group]MCR3720165.1 Protein of unknown function (DUF2637) [Prauserella flava]MCR3734126.1 Protein of unknown function (DUF2637) [Prauserella salsuginis]
MSTQPTTASRGGIRRWALWIPGLLVALGAAAATAHGLFEVTVAAHVPAGIAWVYPVITDGLALVAYLATIALAAHARRYAWFVVVLAAGVSGLAQAAYLAGGVHTTSPELRFGIGAWPAVAAAIAAHLLFLIAHADRAEDAGHDAPAEAETPASDAPAPAERPVPAVDPAVPVVRPPEETRPAPSANERPTVQLPAVRPEPSEAPSGPAAVQPEPVQPVGRTEPVDAAPSEPVQARPVAGPVGARPSGGSQRERAHAAAVQYSDEHGALPTVSRLAEMAGVSRGTAGEVLKALRETSTELHLVTASDVQEAQ